MSLLIKYLLTTYKNRSRKNQVTGFTMVELLIATVMSFLIIVPMLAFAVNILNDDVKEQAKASTELELQSAMDYIQQDISQAYYIYDGAGVNIIKTQLPTVANGTPVLVFWKRELERNAIDVTVTPNVLCADRVNDDDDGNPSTTNPQRCDDTYVDSLVAYYLVADNLAKWCQPGSGNCPARIERWSIKDGIKSSSGTYFKDPDKGFRPYNYDAVPTDTRNYPLSWENSTYDATTLKSQVLVNYISPKSLTITPTTFCINTLNIPASPSPTEANYRIGVDPTDATKFTGFAGCVNNAGNIAQITIRGDALRRNEAKNATCSTDPTDPTKALPYCPRVTGQIGGRSGFGQ